MSLFFSDKPEQIPRTIGEDDAMDFGVVLDRQKQVVESFFGRTLCQTS